MDLSSNRNSSIKRWRLLAVLWPLLCVLFVGMIVCDTARNMEERICDACFVILPLIFFAIGMSIRHRLLKEQKDAVALTTALVVSDGLRIQPGKRNFFPEFAFQAGGSSYRVKYAAGYSFRIVSEGQKVDLYYDPENPGTFYVPAVQKQDRRLSLFLCSVGMIWPLTGLFAPPLRSLLSFLY